MDLSTLTAAGHISTLETRKRSLSVNLLIFGEKWQLPGILLDYAAGSHRQQKRADSGNPWAAFCGLSALRPLRK
jgi:hypothetical protein